MKSLGLFDQPLLGNVRAKYLAKMEKARTPPTPPAGGPTLKAWWKFEEAGPPWIDAVNSLAIVDDSFAPGAETSLSPGKVNNGLRLTPPNRASVNCQMNYPGDAALAWDTGFTFTWWMRLHGDTNDSFAIWWNGLTTDGNWAETCYFASNSHFGQWDIECSDANYNTLLAWQPNVVLPIDEWFFIRWSYDKAAGKFIYQFNNGADQFSTDSATITPTAGKAYIDIVMTDGATSGGPYLDVDELNYYKGVLSDDDATALWNAGAGKTYP